MGHHWFVLSPIKRLGPYPLAAGVAVAVLAGCGPSTPANSAPAPSTLPAASAASVSASAPGPGSPSAEPPGTPANSAAPASPAESVSPTGQATAASPPSPCAPSAVLMEVTSAKYQAGGSLDLTGHRVTTVGCGGPEYDFGYRTSAAAETARAAPGAKITVIPLPMGSPAVRTLPAASFPGYIASDQDTRIFVVTGPLTGITSLYEMYHP